MEIVLVLPVFVLKYLTITDRDVSMHSIIVSQKPSSLTDDEFD